ncbi:hypothetical protein C5167_050601 [Papaver somniferum]|uniref:Uncharacterized protein n=1 Tax=Papaver somniferum TaxID=3469 RepID=A0A4Y7KSI5_PAPSO|nr:uncharacterized protein LOC113303452 isoform X2 [Papaver somniferum]XP_026408275.1 uncharacterized protein LOC113303452 isoform X2 [Papaver somniferum]RZC75118.1 hypothetical protein C5167_050601 [Papaver somniferum]
MFKMKFMKFVEAGAIVDQIELGTLHPFDAVVIPARKFDALMDKLGVYPSYEKPGVYPHHLQRFTEQIESLEECVDETMSLWEVQVGSTRERFSNQKMKVTLYQLLGTRLLCLWVMFLQLLLKTWQTIPTIRYLRNRAVIFLADQWPEFKTRQHRNPTNRRKCKATQHHQQTTMKEKRENLMKRIGMKLLHLVKYKPPTLHIADNNF